MFPVLGTLVVMEAMTQQRATERVLTAILTLRPREERAVCERDPNAWVKQLMAPLHGPDRRPVAEHPAPPNWLRSLPQRRHLPAFFAFDASGRGYDPREPEVPSALWREVQEADVAFEPFALLRSEVVVLARMPWRDGPCAYVLARGPWVDENSVWQTLRTGVLALLVLLFSVPIAMSPIIRRVRNLTQDVQRYASNAYEGTIAARGNDEIAQLARAFGQAGMTVRAQLEARERREQKLREFLANTTHDVMTPLTVLQGHLSGMRDAVAIGKPLERTQVSCAMDEAHYIASLIHNLGAAARLDVADDALELTSLDLRDVVERAISRHRPIARERSVALDGAVSADAVMVRADLTLVEQALSNLIHNAVRYNQPGGMVAVILERDASEHFTLSVIDDGPGIDSESLQLITERGSRGNLARSRAPDGKGFGLHIVQRVAHLHGYTLTLGKSEHGGLGAKLEGRLCTDQS